MYPNLSYLFKDLFGVDLPFLEPFQTFGFMMAIAFLISAKVLSIEMKRKEKLGLLQPFTRKKIKGGPVKFESYLWNAAGGFLVGYKILPVFWDYASFAKDPQHFFLSYDGNFLSGILFAAGACLLRYLEVKKEKEKYQQLTEVTETVYPHQTVGDITLLAAISGLIGAKVFDGLENPATFFQTIVSPFAGLTFYGGLIFGTGTIIWFLYRRNISITHMADCMAPTLILAYGLGRIGCQLAGDGDWGIVNTGAKPSWFIFPEWMWHFKYAHNVIEEGIPIAGCTGKYCNELPFPVFPTPFYEIVTCLLIFGFLWMIRKRIKTPGVLFSIYLIFNGLERFTVELIRVNSRYKLLGLSFTQAELIALLLILTGIAGIVFFRWRAKKSLTE